MGRPPIGSHWLDRNGSPATGPFAAWPPPEAPPESNSHLAGLHLVGPDGEGWRLNSTAVEPTASGAYHCIALDDAIVNDLLNDPLCRGLRVGLLSEDPAPAGQPRQARLATTAEKFSWTWSMVMRSLPSE